jgi:outer membrane protein assembly factor BamD (BamD/ComL family)
MSTGTIIARTALALLAVSAGCTSTAKVNLPAPGGPSNADVEIRGQDEEAGGILGRIAPKQLYDRAKKAVGQGPNQQLAQKLFQQADAEFRAACDQPRGERRAKAFLEAARDFHKAAERATELGLKEDARFMTAESYFFADNYYDASEAYDRLIKEFDNTRYMDTVCSRRFAIGDYWIKHQRADPTLPVTPNLTKDDLPTFDKFGHGIRVLDKIRLEDPTGKLADDATMREAVAQFEAGRFLRADELFADVRRSFPSSEHQFMAHLMGLKCKLEIYQGPEYSLTPMDEAEQLIRQMRIQFPNEIKQHEEFLTNAWREVRKNKAMHDWTMAKYYDRRKDFGAARHYYEQIARDYSDTSLSEEARNRASKLAGKPVKPAQRLPWLTKLFPTPEGEKPLVATRPLPNATR